MAEESNFAIYTSIGANLAIAATKFIAAALSGSSAMIAEGVHSLVDTADGALLLFGRYRSRRPPDTDHLFGYGQELYFWTLIVAVLFFAVGGGMSTYEGILHILNPEPISDPTWNYAALGVAALFDGASFVVALKNLRQESPGQSILHVIRHGKDPSVFTVVAEDIGDIAGLVIAFIGVYCSHHWHMPWIDGAASIGIGLVMAAVAVVLISESRELLIGERASSTLLATVREAANRERDTLTVQRVLSMHLGPDDVLIVLDLNFAPGIPIAKASQAIARIETYVQEKTDVVPHVYVESQALREGAAG